MPRKIVVSHTLAAENTEIIMLTYVITALVGLLLSAALLLRRRYQYWTGRDVYQIEPTWVFGNVQGLALGKKAFGQEVTDWYNHFKSKGLKFGGTYMLFRPVFIPVEPELIKSIMATDFWNFHSHGSFSIDENDPLSEHLFGLDGQRWKMLRHKLTPTFTSGKIKMMFSTIQACTFGLKEMLDEFSNSGEETDNKDILARFTTDVIGNCAFGIECNSIKNPDAEFRIYGKKHFEFTVPKMLKLILQICLPKSISRHLGLRTTELDVERFFIKVVKDTVKYREKNNIVRKDFMHLLLQLKNMGKVTDDDDLKGRNGECGDCVLNINEIAAQAFVFFLAGFETSSTTMTFALYELATNQDIQEKLRKEINNVLKNYENEVTYDAVKDMKYLDQVFRLETLRKHPPLAAISRECTKSYKIPGTDVVIEKSTLVQIPVQGLHMDPDYFENPEEFVPERFSDENKSKIKPYTYLPFGEGPRICIGLRFGLLQSKIGLISILKNYKVTLNEKSKSPIEMDPMSFLIKSTKGGLWINVVKA